MRGVVSWLESEPKQPECFSFVPIVLMTPILFTSLARYKKVIES